MHAIMVRIPKSLFDSIHKTLYKHDSVQFILNKYKKNIDTCTYE
jgi:hypothetical protein